MTDGNKTEVNVRLMSFPMALGLIFITLKLTGHITWSWFWVTCPLWFGLAIAGAFCFCCMFLAGLCFAAAAVCDIMVKHSRKRKP